MRLRLINPQIALIRPLATVAADAFGDAPVHAVRRDTSFRLRLQVSWNRRQEIGQVPGQTRAYQASVLVRRIDIAASDEPTWEPAVGDVIELVEGEKLFVQDVQPEFPSPPRICNPRYGGWQGWRLTLYNRDPQQAPATTYD